AASREVLQAAADAAAEHLAEDRHGTLDLVVGLASGDLGRGPHRDEFVVRFQQTCGPVMAKGVEDTAFYRWLRLTALNEVGGDPAHFGVEPDDLHRWCARQQADWPAAMTTLSTHDTKRSEDVRARLAALSELPGEWAAAVTAWRDATAPARPDRLDANTEYLTWQTVVGAWPIDEARLTAYLEKATREAKSHTTWTEPEEDYDRAVREFAEHVVGDPVVRAEVTAFVDRLASPFRANVLGQKLLALTVPGVPDVYQGCELVDLSLVDPDNRRPVDWAARRARLAALDAGEPAQGLDDEKLLVVSRALRLRRANPAWFGPAATYDAVETGTPHALAFSRAGSVVTVVSRLTSRSGGWGQAAVRLPEGRWRDELTGRSYDATVGLAGLLGVLPVALLVRVGD
ncbi:MAG TPA: malto-oligosyltrehalose synthase, partial [Actinomycetes bacterium]|nr:malto-oligosyltrehalose synthase [Actinomycetes bacterium]